MESKRFFRGRIRVLSFLIILMGLFVLFRLFSLQVVKSEDYLETADRSYVRSSDTFDRGSIFFEKRDGARLSAATVNSGFILTINPTRITDAEDTFEKLNEVIALDREDFLERANKKGDPYEEVADKISRQKADEINELDLDGVTLYRQKWRFYPGKELAAHVIGFLGFGGGEDLSGQYGLEKYYNETLQKEDEDLYVNIFAEIFSGVKDVIFEGEQREGDIVTTIEPTVQNFLEERLVDVTNKFSPEAARGLIMDPQTGEIIAMASLPTFDLNNFNQQSDVSIYSNPLVENVYEFGSVIKPLVLAIGIENKVLDADTPFYDSGSVQVEDKEIFNFDKKGRGQVTMQDVLSESLNTGMVYAMQKIGRADFKKGMLEYRLGERSNIDLPNEARGLVSNLSEPRDLEYATASFGQGISFSPVVLARAWASLGNGGYLVKPHVVKKIEYHDGLSKTFEFPKEDQPKIFSDETSSAITKMLVYSVDNVYGGGKYKMDRYSIAAKTGTAQIPHPEGGYYEDRNLHTFVGYLPAYDPKFLVFLSIRSPRGVRYAAETLSDPFFDISQFLISYYELTPDR